MQCCRFIAPHLGGKRASFTRKRVEEASYFFGHRCCDSDWNLGRQD